MVVINLESHGNLVVSTYPSEKYELLVGGAITILKNMKEWEGLSRILWKIKHV